MEVERLVRQAQGGNREALADLVSSIQDDVYYLALRMSGDPLEAEDATQEILILVITKLSTFESRCAFRTWVYRVASNYLLDNRRRKVGDPVLSFEEFRADLEKDLQEPGELARSPEYLLMLNEVRFGCTMAMLLCLDRKHRLAYILGEIFELDHVEASEILDIRPATFRKQLSRARFKVLEFTRASCGWVSPSANCSCDLKLCGAIARKRVTPEALRLATEHQEPYSDALTRVHETVAELRTLKLQTSVPRFGCSQSFGHMIEELVRSTESSKPAH